MGILQLICKLMYYNLHTHNYTADKNVLEVVNRYPYEEADVPYFSTGIHPWYIQEDNIQEHLLVTEQRLAMPNCLALGECGLDKRIHIPLQLQQTVFEKQLLLAKRYNKPVILHLVAAYAELIAITDAVKPGVPIIVHGFSKNREVAKQLLDKGFYLSFGKYLLRNEGLSEVFKHVPDDHFLLETDTIEEGIADVYNKAAVAKGVSVQTIIEITQNNFKKVFSNG